MNDINQTTNQDTPTGATQDWNSASDTDVMNADIIIAMGLETLSEAEKVAIIDEMTATVQLGVAKRVMDQLDEAKQQELSSMMEKDDSEALNQFLDANIPDFETLIEQEMVAFKRAMLTGNTSPQA
jgi:hypothetical protein